ncbi:MAG: hypothetical protein ACYDC3_01750 [Candidatus Binataceae bacterium]
MRKGLLSVVMVAFACGFLSSCTALDESAKNVKYSTKREAPSDCKELGEVAAGTIVPLYDIISLKNAIRNNNAEMGGDFLVVDEIKSVANPNGGSTGYTGSGRAYKCPEGPPTQ